MKKVLFLLLSLCSLTAYSQSNTKEYKYEESLIIENDSIIYFKGNEYIIKDTQGDPEMICYITKQKNCNRFLYQFCISELGKDYRPLLNVIKIKGKKVKDIYVNNIKK